MPKRSPVPQEAGTEASLEALIEQKEPRILHTDVVPELLSLGWGLVQRVYFFELTSAGRWRRTSVTVQPRPLSLAYAHQDVSDVRERLLEGAGSAACLVHSLEVGPGASTPKQWRVLTTWVDGASVLSRAHLIERTGEIQSLGTGQGLPELLPLPLKSLSHKVASLEREYHLVVHGLDERLNELLCASVPDPEQRAACARALHALVLEVSARRADDVLASYLCVVGTLQDQVAETLKKWREEDALRQKRQARQHDERTRKLQHQLDVALKRATALQGQLQEARGELARRGPLAAPSPTPETGPAPKNDFFEAQCLEVLSASSVWRDVLNLDSADVEARADADIKAA